MLVRFNMVFYDDPQTWVRRLQAPKTSNSVHSVPLALTVTLLSLILLFFPSSTTEYIFQCIIFQYIRNVDSRRIRSACTTVLHQSLYHISPHDWQRVEDWGHSVLTLST